jgi:hypothetical protein
MKFIIYLICTVLISRGTVSFLEPLIKLIYKGSKYRTYYLIILFFIMLVCVIFAVNFGFFIYGYIPYP